MLSDSRKTVLVAFGLVVAVAWILDGNGAADQGLAAADDAIRAHQSHGGGAPVGARGAIPAAAPAPTPAHWFATEADPAEAPKFDPVPRSATEPDLAPDPAKVVPPRPVGADFP